MITTNPIIHIVDDSDSIRDALSLLMKSVGLQAKCYASAQSFLDSIALLRGPGCLVLDVRMPGMSGLELQEVLMQHNVQLPIIIVTGHADVPMAVRAMKNGAINFFEKPFNDQALLECIHDALKKSEERLHKKQVIVDIKSRMEKLSKREYEVMCLIVDGQFSKGIGAQLGISSKTVDVHRARILDKLQVKTAAEIVRLLMTIEQDVVS